MMKRLFFLFVAIFATTALWASDFKDGHEYVDLGLSVKWATCNVGANKPEEYGDYFAWGEVKPKEVYDWSTYKWYNSSTDRITKFYKNGLFELSDDAARVNWGSSWRMPTMEEQDELRIQCTWTWTTQNGVNGYKVTSKSNGNSIFLPAAGFRYDSSLFDVGSDGNYWSSSYNRYAPGRAGYNFNFDSSSVDKYEYFRFIGQSVRPVCP